MSKCDECGITPAYEGGVFCTKCKPQTNADRIRNMTDEGLTEFMVKTIGNSFCPPSIADESIEEVCRGKPGGCMRCWLDWLKEEAMQNDS